MTSALLQRSAAFAAAGWPVTVLTFDDRLDTAAVVERMRASGALAPGVAVTQLWDWLAAHPVTAGAGADRLFTPLGDGEDEHHEGVLRRRTRRGPDGTVLQVDRYRPDGSLLVSDRRDVTEPGVLGGRSVVLCDAHGEPVRGWGSVWALYRFWLDALTDRRRAVLIVDSKTSARFVRGYRRAHALTVHLVHSSHRGADGAFKASRREVLEHADQYDAVVVLTERQRRDLEHDLTVRAHVAVVPNARELDELIAAPIDRPRGRGVMLASLTGRKRVPHAVSAVARASHAVRLDVYGDGDRRGEVEAAVAAEGAAERVVLHGHRSGASGAFRDGDFSLLTSTAEGAPLVLVESMAAGCIPIAYDIEYGPSDMIRDGVDGYVVPAGDVAALAERIDRLQELPEDAVRAMRASAREASLGYTDEAVTQRWSQVLEAAAARKGWRAEHRGPVERVLGGLRRRVQARRALPAD
ncbi:glycosyltransferase [Arenivirga flava]|uniref:Glycosyl transferase family 1 domain-containing protein n=1 Tax=Arenivirga flava TaxID=1930060 RepID=A0AA37UAU1_9MICO|nr:glycosyltransferase [Arenivirga flava]GMA27354.1 hypothetical protein GCM10025874_06070 [Arenivirga flava]